MHISCENGRHWYALKTESRTEKTRGGHSNEQKNLENTGESGERGVREHGNRNNKNEQSNRCNNDDVTSRRRKAVVGRKS